jgi:hypothetical protein
VLSVALERVTLRTNAYVELHAWLAAAGRDAVPPPPGLEAAADVYRRALADDDEDELLARTTAALGRCSDDRCATEALARTPFARAFSGSFATFTARWWTERATLARAGIELARGAFSAESEGVLQTVAAHLGIDWPNGPVAVDVVVESPPAGHDALVGVALSVHDANIRECVLVRALLPLRNRSKVGSALDQRAWDLLVIHSVAATTGRVSPPWRSAYAVEPKALDWLKKNWEPNEAFVARWGEVWPKVARDLEEDR